VPDENTDTGTTGVAAAVAHIPQATAEVGLRYVHAEQFQVDATGDTVTVAAEAEGREYASEKPPFVSPCGTTVAIPDTLHASLGT